jgi:hypothetical protein
LETGWVGGGRSGDEKNWCRKKKKGIRKRNGEEKRRERIDFSEELFEIFYGI